MCFGGGKSSSSRSSSSQRKAAKAAEEQRKHNLKMAQLQEKQLKQQRAALAEQERMRKEQFLQYQANNPLPKNPTADAPAIGDNRTGGTASGEERRRPKKSAKPRLRIDLNLAGGGAGVNIPGA